ncbi:MAG: hypothetical protein ACO1OB_32535 [Archangium sp.]
MRDMETTDPTLAVLREIRDEGKRTNERLDQTNARLDQTNDRLDQLTRRVVDTEVRLGTALAEVAGSVNQLATLIKQDRDLRQRVDRCEHDIAELKTKLSA